MSKMAFVDETPVVYDGVMETLRQRRGLEMDDTSEDNEILKLSGREMLDEWLSYIGIIGYTNNIIEAIYSAYGIDLNEYPFDEPIERLKEKY